MSGLVKIFKLIYYPFHLRSVCCVSSSVLDLNHTDANPDLLILMQNQGPNPLS